MNPYTGRTEPEKHFYLQKALREMRNPQNRISGVPGEPNNDETNVVHILISLSRIMNSVQMTSK